MALCCPAAAAGLEIPMASKDKGRGDKSSKKKASRSLKEKRAAKKSKRGSQASHSNRSVDQTFGH